jgi:hypothetical protein
MVMIQEYSDFLPVEIAEELYNYGVSVAKHHVIPRALWTNLTWHDSLTDGSSLVLCIRPTEELEKKIEDLLLEKGILDLSTDQRITQTGAAINVWGRGSFITEHTDHNYSKAVTVYLNKDWIFNHGGIFHWKSLETGDWYSVSPHFNKAVVNGGGIPHGISPVQSDYRITLQIFVHKATSEI